MVFIIEDASSDNNYILRSLVNNEIFTLSKTSNYLNSAKTNEIIYIFNFYHDNNTIKLKKISFIEKLTEENLIVILENNKNFMNKSLFLGKIVEICIDGIIVLNDEKKLYKLIKKKKVNKNKVKTYTNEELKNFEIFDKLKNNEFNLGNIFLITNFEEKKNENNILSLIVTKNTFFYLFNEIIYFSNKIKLNNLSVIQFHFLDYKEQNYYNEIEVKGINKLINYNTINIVIENIRIPNYEYYPISIKLISTKEKETISFKFNLIHGFLNKINAFINQRYSKPYFYEYLYYSFNEIFFQTNKTIKINDTKKIINICDNFESSNRIRFNILNIPFQNKYLNELQNSNSILECEVFIEKNSTTVGIFDINEIENNIPKLISNEVFDIYYEDFGFIYNFLSNFDNIKTYQT